MKWLDNLFNWTFTPVKPAEADPLCTYCKGLGYDASGYACTCVKEKK
jgi:hypothetical protein